MRSYLKMTTFIDRMRTIANDKEIVQRTFANEYQEKKNVRQDQLFKSLTFRYYDEIKKAIENASKHGRQYVYMNFDRDAFKANFSGLGNPAQVQRSWLKELCDPNSKYLEVPNWRQPQNLGADNSHWDRHVDSSDWCHSFGNNSMSSVFDPLPLKKDCFQGLNYDVWNNVKFTTVFSWDANINNQAMCHYHTRIRESEVNY